MSSPLAPVLRFAPSPNGRLHLGHAYSALMNEQVASRLGGRLLLRIEDIDAARSTAENERGILEDLAWLGIAWSGPPERQSEHGARYAAALAILDSRGLLFPCFCTRGEVARRAAGQRDPDGAPVHCGRCVAPSGAVGEPALRLDMRAALGEAPGLLFWSEYGEGDIPTEQRADPAAWGDIVLKRRDAAASYHLAVVVDDAASGISDVVRGRDLFFATGAHRLLQELLGLEAPRYRHHRLVRDASGAKLSKSAGSTALAALRGKGISAAEIRTGLGFAPDQFTLADKVGAACAEALGASAIN